MIQLPAGATVAMPGHGRDLGLGCRPGGVPGIQTRHSPGSGKWPGGTPSVAAVLEPRFTSGPRTSGLGGVSRMMVLVVREQAPATRRPATAKANTRLPTAPPPKWGPNVVFGVMP